MSLTTRLTPKRKEAILAALRSGKYKQGRLQLKTLDGKYCCLGVMNEVCALGVDSSAASIDGHLLPSDVQGALSTVNDGASREDLREAFAVYGLAPAVRRRADGEFGASFKSIANWLEATNWGSTPA